MGTLNMGKYDPLRDRLRTLNFSEFTLTFREIEDIIGAPLPDTAMRPQWWANVKDVDSTHVQRNAWRDAGFDAFLIRGSKQVKFKKAEP
jgi:hypothetical protein